jgi:hypothetical protein
MADDVILASAAEQIDHSFLQVFFPSSKFFV